MSEPMTNIHEQIESFLLPGTDMRYLPLNQRASRDISDSPFSRLDHIMYQVALADHIRTLQIMYRDGEDDQRLASELREGDSQGIPLTTKHLMEKICEGRSRAAALCRLCYGEDTLESLRALTDLGSSYALQGMWPQVNDHVSMASQKLISLSSSKEIMEGINLRIVAGRRAAARVDLCFRVLRTHAMSHQGHISHIFMRELMVELSFLPDGVECGTELITEMHEYFERFSAAQRSRDGKSPSSRSNQSPQSQSQSQPARRFPSWGDMVKYLREENETMKQWLQEMEGAILPQNKAAMHLPFRACDEQKRGIAHPAQLSATIMKYSSTLKVIAGTTLLKQLNQMKIEVPLAIDQRTGQPVESEDRAGDGDGDGSPLTPFTPVSPENLINVVYELPVAWEEVLSKHILEGSYNTLEMIRAQVLTLLGVSQVFGNKLDVAEENLKEALKQLEKIGLEMEITACELYNSIAQLMITKHRRWDSSRTSQMKKDAMFWVTNTPEGRNEVQRRYNKMEQHFVKRHLSYSIVELEMRARNAVLRSRLKKLAGEDPPEDPTRKAIEAAYRYLVRAHEIFENTHGPMHPAVATGCLAVASIKNIVGGYEEAREWLIKAMRIMEKLEPVPGRAIAFVQVQLSQVMSKQGYEGESLNVMARAADYHRQKAQEGIVKITEFTTFGPMIRNPPKKGQILFDDINLAVDLAGRLVRAHAKAGRKKEAADLAEGVADLVEAAFDWDSVMTADARREAGERHAAVGDWTAACVDLRKSLEALECLCGKGDKRTIEVAQLLSAALENRLQMHQLNSVAGVSTISGGASTNISEASPQVNE